MTPEQFAHLHRYQYSSQSRPDLSECPHCPPSTVQAIGILCALHSPVICVVCDTMEYSTGKTLVETTITLLLAPRVEASRLIRITKRNRGAIYLIFQPECMGQSLMCCISPEDCGKEHTCHSNAKGNHEMVTPDHRHKGTVLIIIPDLWPLGLRVRTKYINRDYPTNNKNTTARGSTCSC